METDSPLPVPITKEKNPMKDKLMDILSIAIMCLVFVLLIKMLILTKGGLIGKKISALSGLVKALATKRI